MNKTQVSYGKAFNTSMNSNQNDSSFTIFLAQSSKKKKDEEKFWIKERLKYKIEKTSFEVDFNGNVDLVATIKNCDNKTWPEDVRVKSSESSCKIQINQPIAKKIRVNGISNITINLKMKVEEFRSLVGEILKFDFVGINERKNLKYCSESFKVVVCDFLSVLK